MKQSHIELDDELYDFLTQLKDEFNSLNDLRRGQFIARNGFNARNNSEFLGSAIMVCIEMGLAIGDLKIIGGRLTIDKENLRKGLTGSIVTKLPWSWEDTEGWKTKD